MPQFTQTTTNVRDRDRELQNVINSASQFAGVMYQIQQAKSAELTKQITVTSNAIDKMPKNLQAKATIDILVPLLNKAMPGVFKPNQFDQSKIADLPKYIQGMDKFKNDPIGLQKYTAMGVNLFTTDEYKALENVSKTMAEGQKQAEQAKQAGIISGLTKGRNVPTTIEEQISQGLSQVPQQEKFTEYTLPERQQKLMDIYPANPKLADILAPKVGMGKPSELEHYVNADTKERISLGKDKPLPGGNWYKLGGTPAEEGYSEQKLYDLKTGKVLGFNMKNPSERSLYNELKGSGRYSVDKPESALDITKKKLDIVGAGKTNILKDQAIDAGKRQVSLAKLPHYADAYKMTVEMHKDDIPSFDETDRIKKNVTFVNDIEKNMQLLEKRFPTGTIKVKPGVVKKLGKKDYSKLWGQ